MALLNPGSLESGRITGLPACLTGLKNELSTAVGYRLVHPGIKLAIRPAQQISLQQIYTSPTAAKQSSLPSPNTISKYHLLFEYSSHPLFTGLAVTFLAVLPSNSL